jgi:REP element-mobilizing transposase RayT
MKFNSDSFYHVFNRGNNRQIIFPQNRNYFFFKDKIRKVIGEYCDIVAYCLMPNHFHFLLYVNEDSRGLAVRSKPLLQVLEQKLGTLQSSYTRAINNQENKTGSLFQSKIKVIELEEDYAFTCFHYIHQNPLKANLVNEFIEWPYSSYNEYISSNEGICNREIAFEFLEIPKDSMAFAKQSREVVINEDVLSKLSRLATQSGRATDFNI